MIKIIYIYAIFCLFTGCIGSDSKPLPKLEFSISEVSFCNTAIGETAVQNSLQLRNPGKGNLTINSIGIRGDENCEFSCRYADPANPQKIILCGNESSKTPKQAVIVSPKTSLLVQISYAPISESKSVAAVVVESDAANLLKEEETTAVTVIPLCGQLVTNTEPQEDEKEDGGKTENCISCNEIPQKGAPSCTDR